MASLLSSASFSSACVDSRAASSLAACSQGLHNLQSHGFSLGFQSTHIHACCGRVVVDNQERFLVSAYKKRLNDKLPPGAFDMVDEETGDHVIWFGIEGQEDKFPTDEMLQWEPVKYATRGDISDQAWLRMLQSSPTGDKAYSSDDDISIGSSSNKGDLVPKRSYPDAGSLKTKGLFSKLKVQNIKVEKKSGECRHRRASTQQDMEVLESLRKNVERRMLDGDDGEREEFPEMAVRGTRIGIDENRRQEITKDVQNSTTVVSPVQNVGNRRRKASQVQRSSREVVAEDFFSIKTFKHVGANDKVLQALQFMEMRRPSQIQALAYEHILNGRSCIVADQTGSGKTLAYLAPLFQRFLMEEEQGLSRSFPNRPRCLVMVPTSELASQVLNVCRLLSKGGAPLRSMVATGGFRLKTQVEALENSADVVIATPGRFLQLVGAGTLALDNLKSVVLDEVDVLFDDPEFSETLEKVESLASIKTQYIHVTATLPVDVCDNILEKHPNSLPLMGPGLHCTAAGLQEVLVDCSGEGEKNPETAYENKRKALLQLVEQHLVPKTLIFCNKIETCRKVENALKRFDRKGRRVEVLPYHAALSLEARLDNMQKFMQTNSDKHVFLVCTDRASRGLDLVDVEHVILFDFPRDPSEYVRRVGRTARAGGAGKAFVFVVGKQVSLARKIMIRNEKGHPIHSVPTHAF